MGASLSEKFWTQKTYDPFRQPEFVRQVYPGVSEYVTEFLCAPHPYRKGAMCPFVPVALKKDHIFYSCIKIGNVTDAVKKVFEFIDYYLALKEKCDIFSSSLIVLFENSYPIEDLIEIQYQCKEICIQRYLMIGALYPTNQSPSLHNASYYPLRTPSPVLVLRDLTASDLIFLDPSHYNIKKRIGFLKSFIRRFESAKSESIVQQLDSARALLGSYEKKYFRKRISIIFILAALLLIALYAIIQQIL